MLMPAPLRRHENDRGNDLERDALAYRLPGLAALDLPQARRDEP